MGSDLERLPASADASVFTLDPKDKYLPAGVRRASTTSAVQSHKRLQLLPSKNPEAVERDSEKLAAPPRTSASLRESFTLEEQRPLFSIFNRLRKTRSAGSDLKAGPSWPRKIFSRSGQGRKKSSSDEVPEVPELPPIDVGIAKKSSGQIVNQTARPEVRASEFEGQRAADVLALPTHHQPPSLKPSNENDNVKVQHEKAPILHSAALVENKGQDLVDAGYLKPAKKLPQSNLRLKEAIVLTPFRSNTIHEPRPDILPAPNENLSGSQQTGQNEFLIGPQNLPSATETLADIEDTCDAASFDEYVESSAYSYAASDGFSPCLASNTTYSGPMSPYRLSQPETPIMSDFDESDVVWKRDSLPISDEFDMEQPSRPPPPPPRTHNDAAFPTNKGFQGYSLPTVDHQSSSTVRKLPSTTPVHIGLNHRSSKQSLVHSWDDGGEHRMSALQELVDDMGYLGDLIN